MFGWRFFITVAVFLSALVSSLGSNIPRVSAQSAWTYQVGDIQSFASGTTQFQGQIYVGYTSSELPCVSETSGWIYSKSDSGIAVQIGQAQTNNDGCPNLALKIFAQDPNMIDGYCYQSQMWSYDCEVPLSSLNLYQDNWYTFTIELYGGYEYLGVVDGSGALHWVMAVPDASATGLTSGAEVAEFQNFDGSVNPYNTSSYSFNDYFAVSAAYNGAFYYPPQDAYNAFVVGPYSGTLCGANPVVGEQFYDNRKDFAGTNYACS